MERLKYSLLKVIHISGLTFLEPVVRLCYGEEPQLQLKKIGRFIVVPSLTFITFLWLWSVIAPVYKTKSGEVPTPAVVYAAACGIQDFHNRENEKEETYLLSGQARMEALQSVEQQLASLEKRREQAEAEVEAQKNAREAWIAERIAPLDTQYKQKKADFQRARERREKALQVKAAKINDEDLEARNEFIRYVLGHQEETEREREILEEMRSRKEEIRDQKFPPLQAAQTKQTEVAEQMQFLSKQQQILARSNRSLKLEEQRNHLEELRHQYAHASGPEMIPLAEQMLQTEQRMAKIATSEYAKPWTLPMQIVRSVVCVFAGFFLATVIAIPIGILCGVSPTFMAAVTPFIALFKPVSPIVWLPISLIIVGGVITDPEQHWLMVLLSEIPLLGWLQINPAFIASAITVALCSLWPTLVNTALGVASIDKDHLNVARVLRLSFTQRLFKIVIPSALPLIFAGLRISLGVGWMVLIAAELLSSSEGIGKFVWDMFNNGSSETFAQMFVVVFIVGVIGLLLDRIMIIFQRLVSFDGAPATI